MLANLPLTEADAKVMYAFLETHMVKCQHDITLMCTEENYDKIISKPVEFQNLFELAAIYKQNKSH